VRPYGREGEGIDGGDREGQAGATEGEGNSGVDPHPHPLPNIHTGEGSEGETRCVMGIVSAALGAAPTLTRARLIVARDLSPRER